MERYLEHHGIKGMKWGVRRYQNPDGTLTSAGRKRLGYGPAKNSHTEKAIINKKLKSKQKEFDAVNKEIDELEDRQMKLEDEMRSLLQWDEKKRMNTFKNDKDRERYNKLAEESDEIEEKLYNPYRDRDESVWDKYNSLEFEIDQLKKGRDVSSKDADAVRKAFNEAEGWDMGEKDYDELYGGKYGLGTKVGKELSKLKDQRDADIASDSKIQKLSEEAHQPGAYGSEKWFEWRDAIWDKRIEYNEKFTDALIKNSDNLKDYSNNKGVRDFINDYAKWHNDQYDYYSIWDPDSNSRDYGLEEYLNNWKRGNRKDIF